MRNLLLIVAAILLLIAMFRRKYFEIKARQHVAHVRHDLPDTNQEIIPVKKKPLPKNFAEVNAAFRKGEMEFAKGNIEKAEPWFIKVIALYEHHEEALNRLGVIAIRKGEPLKAELLYRRLLSLNLKEPVYYCNYGRALYNQKKLTQALEAYEMALMLDPTKANRFVSTGQIYYETGDIDKALEKFLEAHRLEPRNLEYLELITDLYESMGQLDQEKMFLEKVLAQNPYDERAQGRLKIVQGETEVTKKAEVEKT